MEYRSAPFWAWNDKLSERELVWQISEMKENGMGGFFMHSREGLETGYMSKEWLHCIRKAVKAAKEAGMHAWLYDEDRFPSGGAGGIVAKKGGDAFRAKALTLEVASGTFTRDDEVLAVYRAVMDKNSIIQCELLADDGCLGAQTDEYILIIRRQIAEPSEWFNDDAPTDNLNPDCVAAFIQSTHEKYKIAVGVEFGGTVPGIFTDEPANVDFRSVFKQERQWIPWTDGFSAFFRKKRMYDITPYLPFIFLDGKISVKIRHDYWWTITERFCESYSKQIGQWCEKNNLAYTGHYLAEHSLGNSTLTNGAVMPHYRYQHVPGIDLLGEQTDEYLTVKQCVSVAHQYGRKRVISEMYGCTGWDFTFEGQKWVGDWLFAMGVNFRCQHLALYSLCGCRKRDFPPSFNYNTCWWKYNRVVEDYFARIAEVLSEGEAVRDVIVVHPSTTIWSMAGAYMKNYQELGRSGLPELDQFEEDYKCFIKLLVGIHYDFDFGDEIILSESGRIEDKDIFINSAHYSVVVLYGLKTLLKSTAKLLKNFMDEGGKVITIGHPAYMLEGEPSKELECIFDHQNMALIGRIEELEPAIEKIIPRKVSIRNNCMQEASEFLYCLKQNENFYTLFIVNNDRNNSHQVKITVRATGNVEEWNPLNGDVKKISVSQKSGETYFIADFGPAGSKLYVINTDAEEKSISDSFVQISAKPQMAFRTLEPACLFTRTSPNALLLDECTFRLNSGEWSPKMYVWEAQRKVRDALGMRQIYFNGLPQRYKWTDIPHPNDGTLVEFKFDFWVENVPKKDAFLAVEKIENFRLSLNDLEIHNETVGWYVDKGIRRVSLAGLNQGANELVLSCGYSNRMEVEDCFIIGDFGVDIQRHIIWEPEKLHYGDWCLQGYFHYSGSMVYHFDLRLPELLGQRYFLDIGEYQAVSVEVRIGGITAGHIPWRAENKIDISAFVKYGENQIDIEIMGSPVNLFGPFHQLGTQNPWTDWTFFSRGGTRDVPGYFVKPYGLMGPVNIYRE
jgi:hypothetical protein